jgi:hypothetical protein
MSLVSAPSVTRLADDGMVNPMVVRSVGKPPTEPLRTKKRAVAPLHPLLVDLQQLGEDTIDVHLQLANLVFGRGDVR